MAPSNIPLLLILISVFLGSVFAVSPAQTDTLRPGQQLRDWEQLVSANEVYILGFFTPRGSDSSSFWLGPAGYRYVGIWSKWVSLDPVWVGNPTEPVSDSSGSLSIGTNGVLKITQVNGSPIMVNQRPVLVTLAGNVSATLLDSGNFVIREVGPGGVPGRVQWQSFDYPTNILLPGMKIGFNLKTKKEVSVTSWLTEQVPISGAFRLGLDPSGANQLLVWRRNEIYWSSGILKNNGSSNLTLDESTREGIDYEFKFDSDKYMNFFSYSVKITNGSVLSSWLLDAVGQITVTNELSANGVDTWISESSQPCITDLKNSSAICITEKPTACRKGSEYFEPRRGYMMENGYYEGVISGVSDCHGSCWINCSCIAFQISPSGLGCYYWAKGSKFVPYDNFDLQEKIYLLHSVSCWIYFFPSFYLSVSSSQGNTKLKFI